MYYLLYMFFSKFVDFVQVVSDEIKPLSKPAEKWYICNRAPHPRYAGRGEKRKRVYQRPKLVRDAM